MRITVRLFAALRERAGWSERELDVPDGAAVADVWPGSSWETSRPASPMPETASTPRAATTLAPATRSRSSRRSRAARSASRPEPLDLDAVVAEVADPAAGAIATFIGITRAHSRGRTVTHLEYDAYPEMAEAEMARIADGGASAPRRPRTSRSPTAPATSRSARRASSSPSRRPTAAPAMDACREAIDTLKQTVPIWKKEVFEGGEEWIGREGT